MDKLHYNSAICDSSLGLVVIVNNFDRNLHHMAMMMTMMMTMI